MRFIIRLFAFSAVAICTVQPAAGVAAPLKSTKVMKNLVRECEYVDGVIIRVLASRECPVIEKSGSTPVVPPVTAAQPAAAANSKPNQAANATASDDIILDKAISRCTSIGFVRDSAEFRTCVTEQISLLSK